MKIIVTGSLGNISKPLTVELVEKGHTVTVISSKTDKQKDIEALGATAAIGSLDDADFLATTFTGADAVYCMVPPAYFTEPDVIAYYRRLGANYVQALRQSGVQRVIHLSSYGAHLDKGTGLILGSHHVEGMLNELPGIAITHMRPAYFYYNLYSFTEMIKGAGQMMSNYGGDDKIVMVSPADIAAAIADEIDTTTTGRKIRYVASDECTAREIAGVLGAAIGKPDLQWITIPGEQVQSSMEAHGMPPQLAALFVDMFASLHSGALTQDYYLNKPVVMGKVKLTDFAREFAATYNKK